MINKHWKRILDLDLTRAEFLVWIFLSQHHTTAVTVAEIAFETKLSNDHARKSLKGLVDRGIARVDGKRDATIIFLFEELHAKVEVAP